MQAATGTATVTGARSLFAVSAWRWGSRVLQQWELRVERHGLEAWPLIG